MPFEQTTFHNDGKPTHMAGGLAFQRLGDVR